ncbi:MAG: M50 family metallopeptidase, partial [Saprospiraceae bacterium]
MGPSLQIAKILGIPIKMHWTFLLLIPFLYYIYVQQGIALESGIYIGIVFILVLLCVIFHEYGHALMARRYGIETDDIILSPLFGVARIKQLPKTAFGEFWIAFAGPMVNIGIGIILLVIIFAASPQSILSLSQELWDAIMLGNNRVRTSPHDYPVWTLILSFMMFVNLGLVVFNLVPCFPMDG